ncbi:uncharacterized protein LOC111345036 [Stylophora pistillata]|nr:uncharacterized protein LOC111345036 [Stylophora pistillata]
MSFTAEKFGEKARFRDESEAELIREKLEILVANILTQVEKRDSRFRSTLVKSGSVYEGTKVCRPDEFDFMIRVDSLTDKPFLCPCDKGDGYVKLSLKSCDWDNCIDADGFFSPNLLSRSFKRLVSESLDDIQVPEGLAVYRTRPSLSKATWWPVYADLLGNSGKESQSGAMYFENHGPATTFNVQWRGGSSYKDLRISVDLTLSIDYSISKLLVPLAETPSAGANGILQRCGFHVVPAGFDSWRISFSMVEKEVLATSPDSFKECYRVLKVVRDVVSEKLGWDASLVPSYMFKTVLLSQLFTTGHCWKKELRSQLIIDLLELVMQGIKAEEIQSCFLPKYNLLSPSDHENKLRQCVLEEMLRLMRGMEMVFSKNQAREKRQQIRVLEMVDVLDYMISCILHGKNPSVVWNKVFVNIDNVPNSRKHGWFMNEITDLNCTELSEKAYLKLIQIWCFSEEFFRKLLITLKGELNLLAHKFKILLFMKKDNFERQHKRLTENEVTKTSLHQFAFDWMDDFVDCYIEDDNSTLPSLHKAIRPELTSSGFFQGVAEMATREGSGRGLALLKQKLKQYLFMVPKEYLLDGAVDYVSHIIVHAKEVLKLKLEHISIPELDLD